MTDVRTISSRGFLNRIAQITTDEEILYLRGNLTRRARTVFQAFLVLIFTFALFAIGAVTTTANHIGFISTLGTVIVLLISMGLTFAYGVELDEKVRVLTPLSETKEGCDEALKHVRSSSVCSAYRDTVISSGRQLYLFDLVEMERMKQEERKDLALNEHRELCRELHMVS